MFAEGMEQPKPFERATPRQPFHMEPTAAGKFSVELPTGISDFGTDTNYAVGSFSWTFDTPEEAERAIDEADSWLDRYSVRSRIKE